jgi:hypothetical protein
MSEPDFVIFLLAALRHEFSPPVGAPYGIIWGQMGVFIHPALS